MPLAVHASSSPVSVWLTLLAFFALPTQASEGRHSPRRKHSAAGRRPRLPSLEALIWRVTEMQSGVSRPEVRHAASKALATAAALALESTAPVKVWRGGGGGWV